MKRKHKTKKSINSHKMPVSPKKSLSDILGISGEVLTGEPKLVITGDYLIEIYNHKGIVELTEHQIQVNTRKYLLKITGCNLMIVSATDDELILSGTMISVEKI